MITKYGEIKSIRDMFEDTGEEKIINPESPPMIQVIMTKIKCKICKDILEIQSSKGAMTSWRVEMDLMEMKKHLELHQRLKEIGVKVIRKQNDKRKYNNYTK